jgi:hypothetical protein
MIPKEKAKQLVSKFTFLSYPESNEKFYNPKQCALIAVNEIINSEPYFICYDKEGNIHRSVIDAKQYWQQVKEEIQNL